MTEQAEPFHLCGLCGEECPCRDGNMDVDFCLHLCEPEAYRDPLNELEEGE